MLTTKLLFCSVGKQIVDIPSFVVRLDSQKHIDFALNSPFGNQHRGSPWLMSLGGGRVGRVKRKRERLASKKDEGGAEEDDE